MGAVNTDDGFESDVRFWICKVLQQGPVLPVVLQPRPVYMSCYHKRAGGGRDLGSVQGWARKWQGRVEEMTVMLRCVCVCVFGACVYACSWCAWMLYLILNPSSPECPKGHLFIHRKHPFSLKSNLSVFFWAVLLLQCHYYIFWSEVVGDFCGLLFHNMLSC